ncbi:Peptidoglycan/xylan/chitin deacetylase, PgdA/CDA1 family [Roseateles sp. YR242]|uniref:polysaccharide deacetylase family protein n=1 Tax=Roseateles sp. YR242 TaxID=1855305 RepID=UPI0008B74912|nr:polysaccharide deacetylase family protein [Roseateles sp. YR242]SEL30434.1 Peptidoglycan/xylan/chitin deacetylase, PgdA/CDA1 family [Roseateles sp. YR242]
MRSRNTLMGLAAAAVLLSACQKQEAPVASPTPAVAASASPTASASLVSQSDQLLARYRQMIVLMDGEASLKPTEREAVHGVGLLLFHDMQDSLQALLATTTAQSQDPAGLAAIGQLLDRIETEPGWFDADRLAFKEFLTQLEQNFSTSQSITGLKLAKRAHDDLAVLAEVEQAYEQELRDTFGRFAQRGITLKREKWSDYVAKLKGIYTRERILKDYATILPDLQARPSDTPGNATSLANNLANASASPATSASASAPGAAASGALRGASKEERELFGRQLPPKTVLLTFDDGPHPRYTDEILEILKRYQAPAVFFELGRNLGSVDAKGQIKPGPGVQVAKRVLAAGHPIANHSFTHGVMSKFQLDQVKQEASQTEALLDAAGRNGQPLFRFPYGARNDTALGVIEGLKLRSMMWNVDSLDWSDPIPKSIAARVMNELSKQQRGIVLFHDIHARTVEALPLVLDQLKAEGYRFATWKDGRIEPLAAAAEPPAPDLAGANLYRDSYALVIGIDQYQRWPRLQHAVRDAQAMRDTLQTQFGFRAENVTTLTDGDATRANILRALNGMARDKSGQPRLKRDDRVFVFFAGHGSTRRLPSGREVGYIIPVDAGTDDLQTDAIAMPQLQELGEALPAKHAFFVIDACYSGLGLTRGGAPSSANFVRDNARRLGRQMMTAGGADQQVADDGPGGHSVFTWTLLQALSGKADLNGDGLITATELAAYVAPAVSAIAHQTPAFGSLPGSEGGEFIFELASAPEQALSTNSAQLDAQASALAKRADDARNAQLQPLAAASAVTGGAAGPVAAASAAAVQVTLKGLDGRDTAIETSATAAPVSARIAAQRANDRGLQLYKERRYDEAEAAFTEALKLQPRFALAANNLGFIYFKRDKPAEAARWYRKAIEMDGSRALAHLNLGDALLRAGEDKEAQAAYAGFIELSPSHPRVPELKAWLAQPDAAHRPAPPK